MSPQVLTNPRPEVRVPGEVRGGQPSSEDGVVEVVAADHTQLPNAVSQATKEAGLKHRASLQHREADPPLSEEVQPSSLLLAGQAGHDAVGIQEVDYVTVKDHLLGGRL